jgi:hypothetical protein
MKILVGICAMFIAFSGMAIAQEIVIYDSVQGTGHARPAVDAGNMIGADVHAYDDYGIDAWIADVLDGADIVVFDCHSNYSEEYDSTQLDAIQSYLTTYPDGMAVVALWFMTYEVGHPLWTTMGVSYCSDFTSPIPIYQWEGHPIWSGIPNPINNTDVYYRDGAKVEPTGDAVAIGGFTSSPETCQAGLVINGCRTVYIGECGVGGWPDDDSDGVPDWTELYVNIFNWLLDEPSPVSSTTWGQIKELYR